MDTQNLSDRELVLHEVRKFQPFPVGDYQVTALTATHGAHTDPVVYIIKQAGKAVFYVHDSSDFPQENWEYLEICQDTFDLVSLDCTEGDRDISYPGHMNVKRCREMKARLVQMGLADSHTRFVLNHFSHNGYKVLYEELVEFVKPDGFEVAYDGMVIEL